MAVARKFAAIVGLGLVISLTAPAHSHYFSCDNEELTNKPTCPARVNSERVYFPVPGDCYKFFECINGQAKCLRCPFGTVWDQRNSACIDESSHPCETGRDHDHESAEIAQDITTEEASTAPSQPTTTPAQSTTSTTPRPWHLCPADDPMPAPGTCPLDEPISTFFPYPYDCQKYFQCANGVAICMRCANGTAWDQQNTVCDRLGNIGCNIVTTVRPAPQNDPSQENGIVSFFKKLNPV